MWTLLVFAPLLALGSDVLNSAALDDLERQLNRMEHRSSSVTSTGVHSLMKDVSVLETVVKKLEGWVRGAPPALRNLAVVRSHDAALAVGKVNSKEKGKSQIELESEVGPAGKLALSGLEIASETGPADGPAKTSYMELGEQNMTEDQEMLISLLDLNSSTSDALLKLPADLVDMKNTLTNEKTHYENFVATQRDLSVKEHQALKKLREEAEGLNLSIHLPSNVSHSDVSQPHSSADVDRTALTELNTTSDRREAKVRAAKEVQALKNKLKSMKNTLEMSAASWESMIATQQKLKEKERGVLNTLTEIDGIFKSTRRGKGKGRHKQRAGPRKLKNGNAAVKSKPGTSLAARAKDIAKGTSLADVDGSKASDPSDDRQHRLVVLDVGDNQVRPREDLSNLLGGLVAGKDGLAAGESPAAAAMAATNSGKAPQPAASQAADAHVVPLDPPPKFSANSDPTAVPEHATAAASKAGVVPAQQLSSKGDKTSTTPEQPTQTAPKPAL